MMDDEVIWTGSTIADDGAGISEVTGEDEVDESLIEGVGTCKISVDMSSAQ